MIRTKAAFLSLGLFAIAAFFAEMALETAGLADRVFLVPKAQSVSAALVAATYAYVCVAMATAIALGGTRSNEQVGDMIFARTLCWFGAPLIFVGGAVAFGCGFLIATQGSVEANLLIWCGLTAMVIGLILICIEDALSKRRRLVRVR